MIFEKGRSLRAPHLFGALAEFRGHLPSDDRNLGFHPRLDQHRGQKRAGRRARDAMQLLVSVVAVEILQLAHPRGFALRRPLTVEALRDLFIQSLRDRLLERDAMQRVGPPARANVADQFVEGAVGAVVGRDDAHASAPHGERERGFEQSLQVVVKSRLVDHRATLLAAQVGWPRGERDDFVPRGEADSIAEDVAPLIVDRDLLDPARDPIEFARPPCGGLDELERHVLVVADVPGVHAVLAGGGKRAIGGLAPGETDAAGFFADLDLRGIGDPLALIGQQQIEAAVHRARLTV